MEKQEIPGTWKWYEERHRNKKDYSEYWEHQVISLSWRKVFLKRSKMEGKIPESSFCLIFRLYCQIRIWNPFNRKWRRIEDFESMMVRLLPDDESSHPCPAGINACRNSPKAGWAAHPLALCRIQCVQPSGGTLFSPCFIGQWKKLEFRKVMELLKITQIMEFEASGLWF